MKTFFILAFLATCAFAADYCKKDIFVCPPDKPNHIGCKNSKQFAKACGSGAMAKNFSPALIAATVEQHNSLRSKIANGELSGFSPAVRMANMEWDPELAQLAKLNVMQCEMKHDCHNTIKCPFSGQNLFYAGTTQEIKDVIPFVKGGIQDWFDEYKHAKMEYINKFPSTPTPEEIRHFTVMVGENNTKVGCAYSLYKAEGFNNILVCCNYATTNMRGQPIYISGAAGSKCTTKNSQNLCI